MKSNGFTRFLALLTCLDPRVDRLPFPQSTVYYYLEKLRSSKDHIVLHVGFTSRLGIGFVYASKRVPDLARLLASGGPRWVEQLEAVIPAARYIHTITLAGGEVHVTWYNPPGSGVAEAAEQWAGRAEPLLGVPVQNCLGETAEEPGRREKEQLAEHAERLLEEAQQPLALRTPIIAYMIAAALDYKPLATLRELADPATALGARGLLQELSQRLGARGLRARLLRRYYRLLSQNHVVGRAAAYTTGGHTITYRAPRECYETIYAVTALTHTSHRIYVSGERVYGGLYIHNPTPLRILQQHCPQLEYWYSLTVLRTAFPYEMYDARGQRWLHHTEKPGNIIQALEKYRLLEQK